MTTELTYCPVCGGSAQPDGNRITCAQCGLVFKVKIFAKRKKAELGFCERLKRVEKSLGKLSSEARPEPELEPKGEAEFDAEED